jgi:hypothetical protein
MRRFAAFVTATLLTCTAMPRAAQTLSGPALVTALQRGGYVLVMRHASSPSAPPDEKTANADNVGRERQLDANGRATATAMGQALVPCTFRLARCSRVPPIAHSKPRVR